MDIRLLVTLKKFIWEQCIARLYLIEKGGASTHKHFQMVVKGNFTSLPVLNTKIKIGLGWEVNLPTGHVVFCKRLWDKDLHTFIGMAGYCMKTMVRNILNLFITMCWRMT